MADPIKIIIADDDQHNRLMLKHLLSTLDLEIIAEAQNGKEAVELYQQHQPDILLLDIMMPEMNGNEALTIIQKQYPDSLIIMLTSMDDMETVQNCIDAGASSYILKSSPLREIKEIIMETWSSRHD